MKRTIWIIVSAAALLSACTSGPPVAYQAPYVDREFGMDSRQSLVRQAAYPAGRFADRTPAGLQGITGEAVMRVLHGTFSEKPEPVQVFQMGLTGGN
jgi:hypothetical protein